MNCVLCLLTFPIPAFHNMHIMQIKFGNYVEGTCMIDHSCVQLTLQGETSLDLREQQKLSLHCNY